MMRAFVDGSRFDLSRAIYPRIFSTTLWLFACVLTAMLPLRAQQSTASPVPHARTITLEKDVFC
jgi:hypothetical protein